MRATLMHGADDISTSDPQRDASARSHSVAILAIILISYFMILARQLGDLHRTAEHSRRPGTLDDRAVLGAGRAYTLVFGGLLLLGARAGDLVGRRRLLITGLTVFATASFLVGAAPTGWWLIAARALQGIGAAVVAPTSLSLLTANFPERRERTRAVSWYGATAGIGASLGLVVGGACAGWVSWRAGFFINVPIAGAVIIAVLRYLPETERRTGRFDTVGAVCATLGMGSLVFGIVSSADAGWNAPSTVTALVAGVALLATLVTNEARAAQPIMPLRLFRSRERSGAFARFSNAGLLAAGFTVTAAGMAWLSRVGVSDSYVTAVALPMLLIGIGQGLAFAPLTASGIAGVKATDAGAASGLVNTAHQIGSARGLGISSPSPRTRAPVPRPAPPFLPTT